MTRAEAPGKLNLSLLVMSPRADGYHPVDSLVQTIEWCDVLEMEQVDERADVMTVTGADQLDPDDNLVLRALREVRRDTAVPTLSIALEKSLPIAAGLGGGSSDAAATILGAGRLTGLASEVLPSIATRVGADVPLFLIGGSLRLGGVGDVITPVEPLSGFSVVIVVPRFGLSTAEVYRRWDELGGPTGEAVADQESPPALRGGMPLRNDLLPAALSLEPILGDFMADVRAAWGTPVCLTGSGSACFGYFATVEEAAHAAESVAALCETGRGVELRPQGVELI
ncbi:MAG TPA: 4-(cytidine 5'-diphospho)-2-C-methyl-D-erythritol kinase [Acidimicrobiia bacterium]